MTRVIIAVLLAGAAAAPAQVSYDRLKNALKEPQNWLTYWGDYSAIRHRDLKQITTDNVKDLRLEWMFQTGQAGSGFQTMPLVVDGVMYFTGGNGLGYALDARSGRQLWRYQHPFPGGKKINMSNRGFAMLGDKLYMVSPDAWVVCLEAKTGRLLWQTEMAPYTGGQYTSTLAPLAVKNLIITGISGAEFGIRGFVDAYDAGTGKRVWRFWTIPAKGEPGGDTWLGDSGKRGGGSTWMTGTFDPELNTLYWGVGNPGPDLDGKVRLGDNLYTDSLVALDPDTGKLKWHFQFTPHDTHDWDACETPMLLDLEWQGRKRKLVVTANRNAFFYVLDRETGEFLMGKPFARQTWASGLNDKGRPMVLPNSDPSTEGTKLCPGLAGAANWMAPSYSPQTGLFYFPVREQCDVYFTSPAVYIEGKPYWGSTFRGVTEEKEWGLLKAVDPLSGKTSWEYRYYRAPWAGTLSTAGGVVFAGDEDGYLMAFDARNGTNLWKMYTGARLNSSPITWELDGRQYVTMPSGASLLTFALPR